MSPYDITPDSRFQAIPIGTADRVSAFLRRVYGWMFAGLAITGGIAFGLGRNPATMVNLIHQHPFLLFGAVLVELGLVLFLVARALKMSPAAATGTFLFYSALNGVTLSLIFLAYTMTSIATTFFIAAGMFGGLALFGTVTKRNLAGVGSFVSMGLWGLILAMFVGVFWHTNALQFMISVVGVIVFTGLTAWDAQKMKSLAVATTEGTTANLAIVGALSLYLDFINLFLFLLRFLGNRRD